MAQKIQLLTEHVANQIAAGEVIERPASVVKELVENSLDAGATTIEIEIEKGGKSLIRVSDNGHGMPYDDALLCLERHATSKIRSSDDLLTIASYGFRGEALPSIASVSRFRLQTRTAEATSGTEIILEHGKLVSVKEVGCPVGTMIEVRSLFAHVPARRKFLRTDATEWGHIDQLIRTLGLAQTQVHWQVKHGGAITHEYPIAQNLAQRVGNVFGKAWVQDVVEVQAEQDDLQLKGFVGRAGVSRPNRQEQITFINGRPISNPTLNAALSEGYHNALMRGRYPVALLFISINPSEVDVNVHPSKREVRFRDPSKLRQFVAQAVSKALRLPAPEPLTVPLGNPQQFQTSTILSNTPSFWNEPSHRPRLSQLIRTEFTAEKNLETENARNHDLRIIGVILNLYIIAENASGLVLIDQHAAHERVLFEEMLKRIQSQSVTHQRLLLPLSIELNPVQSQALQEQISSLDEVGLTVSHLGGHTYMIDAVPPMIKTEKLERFFLDVLHDLQQAAGESRKQRRLSEEVIVKTVCRAAVKANDTLKPSEIERLLIDLHNCELPYTCPHGRPTMIMISADELEKKFGRLVS